MKHKARKFRLGGSTDEMGGKAGYEEDPSDFEASKKKSFSEAFREARKAGDSSFMWQGKKYTTEMAGEKKSTAKSKPEEVKVTKTTTEVETPARRAVSPKGKLPESYRPRVGSGRYNDPTSTYGERVTSPLRKLGDIFGLRKEEDVMRNMDVSREEARRRLRAKEEFGMYRGGNIKKMARGGMARSSASRRADGIAKKGKTRGRIV